MSNSTRGKQKLVHRVRRLGGQLRAVEKALEDGAPTFEVLQTLAACRGGLAGLTAEIIEEQVRETLGDGGKRAGAQELIDVVRAYLR